MKKRKPPIVAVTILLVCFAAAVGFNYKSGINPKAEATQEAQAPAPEVKVGEPRKAQDTKEVAASVKSQLGTASMPAKPMPKGPPPGGPPGGPGGRRPGMGGPSGNPLAVMKPGQTKPVPNDSAVSSQWYQPSSSKSGG